ncbi:MAG: MFS transporter, partial [Chloroflexota bacterium]|nr:MFS transporter [Chloroflexota bacterium]
LLAATIPRAALLLFGGAVTDRISARAVMVSSNLVRAALVALLVALVLTSAVHLWQLAAIQACFGLADAFFLPSATAILPRVVADKQLPAANALMGTGEQMAILLGPAVGGVLVAGLGVAGSLALNCLSFLLAAAGLAPAPAGKWRAEASGQSMLHDLGAGLEHAWAIPAMGSMLLLLTANSLVFSGGYAVGLPALARQRFPAEGALALGAMLAAHGAGQLLGALSAAMTGLPRRLGWLIVGQAFAVAAGFALVGALPGLPEIVLVVSLIGFGAAYADDVAVPTWLQRRANLQLLGRVSSLIELAPEVPAPVSFVVFGALASRSPGLAFLAASALMLAAAVVLASSRPMRELRV